MTKYWKTTAQKDGSDLNLYVGTSDECIRRDLVTKDSGGSLIWSARQLKGVIQDDHLDLAIGAFHDFMSGRGYSQSDPKIHEVDGIPQGLKESMFGGSNGNLAVTVFYEE